MRFKPILIDGYCEANEMRKSDNKPCSDKKGKFGAHCLECDWFSWTPAENAIVYSNEGSTVDPDAGVYFGDEMEADDFQSEEYIKVWHRICNRKIREAYDEYMKWRKTQTKK